MGTPMSHYQFAPSPNFGMSEHPFATWNEGFTPEEIDKLIAIGDGKRVDEATIGGGEVNACIRRSQTSWLSHDDAPWLYDKLAYIARRLNGQFYNFDLYGFSEDMQYTVYEGDGGHYTWHQDIGGDRPCPRKLSMVVQLSDPADYEGGDLQIMSGADPANVEKQRGKVVVFPSYMIHRVTPVTSGVRRTLVVWITGPSFK